MRIRVSKGVGSNPKLWACTDGPGATQVGEFDLSDEPGWIDGDGMGGMTGMVWPADGGLPTDRLLYQSVDEWVADVAAMYPAAVIVRADDEPQEWL